VASKQYFVFLAPLLLLHPEIRRPKRAAAVFGVAALTFLPFLLIDPGLLWTATVGNIAGIGFRPDTQSLSGLLATVGIDFVLPRWAWLIVSLAAAIALTVGARGRWDFMVRAALILGFAFLAGLAFPNYWFLVAALASFGVGLHDDAPRHPSAAPA